jgi:hypothetical protein
VGVAPGGALQRVLGYGVGKSVQREGSVMVIGMTAVLHTAADELAARLHWRALYGSNITFRRRPSHNGSYQLSVYRKRP